MSDSLPIHDFLLAPGPILDVRSPSEYVQGHLPGALSFPLFSDQERAQVGTCYKQSGRDAAVELGLELVGPKMAQFVRAAKMIAMDKPLRLHCWRGGMRSGSMAWLLETAGLPVVTLTGGYKAFRGWVRETLAMPKLIIILGGMTGTGKTDILQALEQSGAQVLDLEGLANHRGSSYGALLLPPQPSTEQFENSIAAQWQAFRTDQPVWIEAESSRVGACRVPEELFAQMQAASALEIFRSPEERINLLVNVYGEADADDLVAATERVRKRLGGQRTQDAINFIRAGDLKSAVAILLTYYDRAYRYDLERRQQAIPQVDVSHLSPAESAQQLLRSVQQFSLVSC